MGDEVKAEQAEQGEQAEQAEESPTAQPPQQRGHIETAPLHWCPMCQEQVAPYHEGGSGGTGLERTSVASPNGSISRCPKCHEVTRPAGEPQAVAPQWPRGVEIASSTLGGFPVNETAQSQQTTAQRIAAIDRQIEAHELQQLKAKRALADLKSERRFWQKRLERDQ